MQRLRTPRRQQPFANPQPVVALFSRPWAGWFWFFIRLYVGWQWLTAGAHKLFGASNIGWIESGVASGRVLHRGDRLLQFWQHAVAPPADGIPQVGYAWYRDFLLFLIQHHWQGWFAVLVGGSEFLTGVALILGAFTAVASLAGATMNLNYMLAGSASINPVLFAAGGLLLLAWKSAGYVGLDRWLLPMLGTPWQLGWLFRRTSMARPAEDRAPLARHPGRPGMRLQPRLTQSRRREALRDGRPGGLRTIRGGE